jgi:transcriptional regulator with XRE-family HTH domain
VPLTAANANQESGQSLRARRKERRLSQEALARLAGCSTNFVRVIEGGYSPNESDVLPRIVRVLNETDPADKTGPAQESPSGGDHEPE